MPNVTWAVPLLTQAAVDGVAIDLRSAHAAAAVWCAEVNAAMHAESKRFPMSG